MREGDFEEFWEIPMSLILQDFLVGFVLIFGPLALLWWQV